MSRITFNFRLFRLMLIVFVAVAFAACGGNEIANNAKIIEINHLLESVPLHPSKRLVQQNTDSFSEGALVIRTYQSDSEYTEIKQFYLDELTSEGWQFVAEGDVKHKGRIRSQKELEFQKDNYALTIQFAGDRSQELGWDYAVKIGFPAEN